VATDDVERLIRALRGARESIEPKALVEQSGLTQTKVARILTRLEDEGVVERDASGAAVLIGRARDLGRRLSSAVDAEAALREANQRRVEEIRAYARARECRRALLLGHFGEEFEAPCDACDHCDEARPRAPSEVINPVERQAG
jgi:ATP-dependent DNA helicase RecQ